MFRYLPLLLGFVPAIGVTAAYWLNVNAGELPSCVPFLDGCVSISATGRVTPGDRVFRAALLPHAAFLTLFWWLCAAWLRELRPASRRAETVFASGMIGAIALIVYVTFLGTETPVHEFMRRFGIYFYFLGTVLAQLILTLGLSPSRLRLSMLWVVGSPFILGITNLALKLILEDSNDTENRIEWIAALLMQVWFVQIYYAWRASGLAVTVRTGSPNARR